MAGLISWLGKEAKNAENAIGGAVHGAENYVGHAAQQLPQVAQNVVRQAPQMISRVAPPQIAAPFNLASFIAQHPQQSVGVARGAANTVGGFASQPIVGAGELFNRGVLAPVGATITSGMQLASHRPATWSRNYNYLASKNTNDVADVTKLADKKAGLSLSPQLNNAYAHPAQTAAFTGLAAGGPLLQGAGRLAKGAQVTLGGGFGGYAATQVPALVQNVKNAKTPAQKAEAVTELIGNVGAAGLGLAAAGHGGVGLAKDTHAAYKANPVLNNEGGYLRLPDATGKQKGPQVSYKDGIKGSEVSDKNMKVKPEGVAALQQGKAVPIQNLIDHKAQAKDYPTLYGEKGGVKAVLNNQIDAAYKFDPATRTIHLNPDVLGNTAERVKASLHGDQGKRLLVQGMSKAIDDYAGVRTPLPVETQLGMAMKNGVQPTPAEVGMAHSKLPGELRASSQAERMNMSQRQLKKNPIGQPPAPSPIDQVKQFAKTGLLDERGSVPLDPTQHPNLHLDEPTPAANANLDDVKSVGNALGKTKAYIKRVEAAHKATFGQDGKAWKDYNARYDKGVDGYNAPNKAVWDSYMAGDPKLFPKTRDGMMLQDVVTGDKAVAHPDNPAYNKLYEQKAREAGLAVTHFGNGDVLVGKSPEAVEAYKALASKGKVHTNDPATKQLEYSLLGYRPERFSNKLSQHLEALKNDQKALQERYGELKPKVDPKKVEEFKKSLTEPKQGLELPTGKKDKVLTPEQKQYLENQKTAPSPLTLPKVEEGKPKQAILNAKFAADSVKDRASKVVSLGRRLNKHDLALLDDLRTNTPEELAKQAKNPKKFLAAAQEAKKFTDFTYKLGRGSGQDIGYRKNYGAAALYDLSDEHTFKTLQDMGVVPSGATLKDGNKAGYTNERKVPSYKVGEKLGLKRLNANFLQDIKYDAGRRANDIAELQLASGLRQAFPGQVAEGEIPRGYTQLRIQGGQPLSMPTAIAQELNNRAWPEKNGKIVSAYDAVNSGTKYLSLGGGTFHAVTTGLRASGQQLVDAAMHPTTAPSKIANNLRLVGGTLSRKMHDSNMKAWSENTSAHADGLSTVDRARLAGTTLRPGEILGDANLKIIDQAKGSRINFIKNVHDLVFERQIPEAKLMIFEQKTKGLDSNVPSDLEKMRQVASAVNNFGGINRAIEGLTPRQAKMVARGVLATDFTETKFRLLSDMILKDGPQGALARQMVIGKIIMAALPGLVVAGAAGKLNTPEDWAKEAAKQFLDPQVATPFKSKSGISKVAKLPSTEASELGRIILPLFYPAEGSGDRLAGAKQYVTARSAAGVSTIWSLINNKDYYGDPIVKKNNDGSVNVGKTVGSLALSKAPIPISQGAKVKSGTESAAEGVVNTLGARVVNDPNDPKMQSYSFKQNVINGSGAYKSDLSKLFGLNQTDANGNKITTVPALHTQANAHQLLDHPDLMAKYLQVGQQINDKNEALGLPGDPFYHLSADQQHLILNIQADKFRDPAEKKALTNAANGWLPQYYQDRSNFFDALNLPASTKTQELAAPTASPHVQALFNIADPKARSTALATDPEAQAYFNANDNFINQGRAKQFLPAMKSYPTSTPYIEAQLNAKNYKDPQVQQYLNQVAAYNVEKGGAEAQYQGTNLSQSALKGVKNLGNYGIVQNPDGTLAIAGSNADAPGSQLARYGSSGKKGRKGRATKMAKLPKFKPLAATKLPKFKAPKYTAHTSKLPKIAKAKLPVTRKLA